MLNFQIMDRMLDGGSGATRAGMVFISAGSYTSSESRAKDMIDRGRLLLNVSANSVSAGCDLTALFPRFINIRRGGVSRAS